MRKRPRQKRIGLSPVERAQIRAMMEKEVRETFTSAQIHAAIGDDSDALVNKAGRMFLVVLSAAERDGFDAEQPDIRILRGACNAMYEQKGEAEITPDRRASIASGLLACERLLEELEFVSVVDAAFKLHVALKCGPGVNWSEFEARMEALA